MMPTRRAFADLSIGQVHFASCGDVAAPAVLLLHQTPRSWVEYREVLPLLGTRYRAIAMDTPGFGDSAALPGPASIEGWAAIAAELLDALSIAQAHVVGHHTGGVIALQLAAAHAPRVCGWRPISGPSATWAIASSCRSRSSGSAAARSR
jgi:pimeloyl-ACP methyl ester carboxylesterase